MRGRSARTDCVSCTDEAASLRPITMCRARPSGAVAAGRWPLSQQALLLPTPPSRRARQQAQQAQQALTAAERALDHAFAACARRDEDEWPPARPATGLAAVEIIWRLAAQFCDARALWLTSV